MCFIKNVIKIIHHPVLKQKLKRKTSLHIKILIYVCICVYYAKTKNTEFCSIRTQSVTIVSFHNIQKQRQNKNIASIAYRGRKQRVKTKKKKPSLTHKNWKQIKEQKTKRQTDNIIKEACERTKTNNKISTHFFSVFFLIVCVCICTMYILCCCCCLCSVCVEMAFKYNSSWVLAKFSVRLVKKREAKLFWRGLVFPGSSKVKSNRHSRVVCLNDFSNPLKFPFASQNHCGSSTQFNWM